MESAVGPRSDNQDRVAHFDSPFGSVFVLADGMGGHKGGAIASGLVESSLQRTLSALPLDLGPSEALVEAISTANRCVFEEGRKADTEHRRMGSTVVALLVSETEDGLLAIGAHVGDSRLYFARQERIFRLTKDHTMVQELLKNNTLTEEEAADHPQNSVLTRALGQKEDVSIDLTSWMMLRPGDTFVLCSDGLSGFVSDDAIHELLRQPEPCSELAVRLVDLAYRQGSDDNVSVLVVKVSLNGQADLLSISGSTTTNMK